jgi:glycosyltransferase involved in cell wall biosynthesis
MFDREETGATGVQQRPRIGLDGFNFSLEEGTGVATYGRNLSFAVRDLGASVEVLYGRNIAASARPLLKEIRFFDPVTMKALSGLSQQLRWTASAISSIIPVTASPLPLTGRIISNDFSARLPHYDRIWNARNLFDRANWHFDHWGSFLNVRMRSPPAVMHWTYPLPVKLLGAKNVYSIHDLVPLRLPHTTLDSKGRYYKIMRIIAKRADHIATISESSVRDITEILGVPPSRVTNTYQAVYLPKALAERPEDEIRDELRGLFNLSFGGYFLFFGTLEPKKNIGRLIQAHLSALPEAPLVIVGKRGWKSEGELRLLPLTGVKPGRQYVAHKDGRRKRHVVQLDYVPFPILISLIRGAKAVVFPSLYEGFGLPVLEAMQLGVPVLASNTSSLPEVAGDAALLVDPYNPRAIAEALRRLDSDAGLRAELAARGLKQARQFSTAAYGARLAELYGKLGVTL